ncbi:dolichyl-phosphate-mannose-protein mannosyltransferase [Saccharomycopsis crataegensis]|uniref:Dolichyl-phosphate-mannose--protein mannosyltransferase n=1 Tax=Saccharomycopsis crataegensis TaxID=43959 RepID=A0AAV5QLZ8_9ASCO|nr:dolichyl-phosphate-mannose-protein mannosyltransferase [Saccharomycopsis crataegensis]
MKGELRSPRWKRIALRLESVFGPIIITLLSGYVRLYEISKADKVIWDEAHFGKFGAYYILREFYFDVHPPLGKLLIGFSEYLANFNGSYLFESGTMYPDYVDYGKMRIFNAVFGILVAPFAYFAAKALGYNLWTVYLISFMVTFENIFVVLSKFILLDSMLLFFTATTFYCLAKFHEFNIVKDQPFTRSWLKWLFFTGISIGCVCSVKWVGLFITALVGIYTVFDLFLKFLDNSMSNKIYFKHWALRIVNLICIPMVIYAATFKAHFMVLSKAGTGHASMPSLFQVNLENSDIQSSPRNVAYGSKVTIRSHGLSPNLLHSHVQLYPQGSRQHQVTTYGHKDQNNEWIVTPSRLSNEPKYDPDTNSEIRFVKHGDRLRLAHYKLTCNLHSHQVPSHVTKNSYEVSGYGNEEIGDLKDDWIVEIVEQVKSPAEPDATKNETFCALLHPLSTNFRLKHAELGCYLATTGNAYPAWGFKQGEVICKSSYFSSDKSTWWNVEDHSHPDLTPDEDYILDPPKSNFWRDFILLNFAMQASNNALVPDSDKHDNLASEWWEWIIARRGIRMSSWGLHDKKYYMMPNPLVLWFSTFSLLVTFLSVCQKIYLWQSQSLNFDTKDNGKQFWEYTMKRLAPLIAWGLHIVPFIIMARVTYVHHYVPAEFFAIFVAADVVESAVDTSVNYLSQEEEVEKSQKSKTIAKGKGEKEEAKPLVEKVECTKTSWMNSLVACLLRPLTYITLYTLVIGMFYYFSPVTFGIEGSSFHYGYLKWLETWDV